MHAANNDRAQIQVTVRFYSIVADRVGTRELQRTLPAGKTVGDLVQDIGQEHAPFREFATPLDSQAGNPLRLVCNGRMVLDMNQQLADGDDIRVFPIISGG
jgi:MoaD family protein